MRLKGVTNTAPLLNCAYWMAGQTLTRIGKCVDFDVCGATVVSFVGVHVNSNN